MKIHRILYSVLLIFFSVGLVCGQVDYYVEPEEPQEEVVELEEQQVDQNQKKQGEKKSSGMSLRDRIYVGGGFGAAFGTNAFVNISPIIGFKVTQKFSAGLRLTYQYRSYEDIFTSQKYNSNDYGVGIFARMMLYGPLYAQAEYEYLNYEYFVTADTKERFGFDSFMLGGGIIQPIGKNAAFFVTALYNFSYNSDSNTPQPYGSPLVLRIGFSGGF